MERAVFVYTTYPSIVEAEKAGRALVERRLRFTAEDGTIVDASDVRVTGAFVLDMIAHNNDHDRDVFQIAPGEGAASARLALRAHAANQRWNAGVTAWNQVPERAGKGRAERQEDGGRAPPAFAHLPLHGEIRPEWDPRSALYNTDGQIFSDVGVPVVLFMENYDINRTGYHDTEDTMKNIDLDYAAALAAIAIETVADTACAPRPPAPTTTTPRPRRCCRRRRSCCRSRAPGGWPATSGSCTSRARSSPPTAWARGPWPGPSSSGACGWPPTTGRSSTRPACA